MTFRTTPRKHEPIRPRGNRRSAGEADMQINNHAAAGHQSRAVRQGFALVAIATLVLAVCLSLVARNSEAAGEALPGQGFLPDGRAWELVSPPDKNGSDVLADSRRTRAAGDGGAVSFSSLGFFADQVGGGIAREYVSERSTEEDPGGNGWSTHGIAPPQTVGYGALGIGLDPHYMGDFSDDLDGGVYYALKSLTGDPWVEEGLNLYRRTDLRSPGAGNFELLSECPQCEATSTPLPKLPEAAYAAQPLKPWLAGASPSLDRVVFESQRQLTADEPLQQADVTRVYEWTNGQTRLAGRIPEAPATSCDDVNGPACVAADVSFAGTGALNGYQTPHVASDGSDGHSRVLFTRPTDDGESVSGGFAGRLYMRTDGTSTVEVTASERSVPTGFAPAAYQDASADGRRVFFTSDQQLIDNAQQAGTGVYMYDVDADSEVQKVTINADAGQFTLTYDGQTTADIAFDADAGTVATELNALSSIGGVGGNVEVAKAGNTYTVTFGGELADKPLAELTATDGTTPLTNGPDPGTATVTTTDDGGHLTLLNIDSEPADGVNLGSPGVFGASEDGSHVYFVQGGQLIPGQPTGFEKRQIYLWNEGQLTYVAQGPPGTSELENTRNGIDWVQGPRQARVTPDGRHLLFATVKGDGVLSVRGGSDYDHGTCLDNSLGSTCRELYVYNASSDTLDCASCNPSGATATARATNTIRVQNSAAQTTWHETNALSDDGRYTFFSTAEALVPEDVNGPCGSHDTLFFGLGGCIDAYVYDTVDDEVSLLSSGESEEGSFFMEASPDGRNAFFVTSEQLVGWDTDGSRDLYVARVGGGFPEPEPGQSGCVGDGCQDPGSNQPPGGELGPSKLGGPPNPSVERPVAGSSRCDRLARSARRAKRNARTLKRQARRAVRLSSPNARKLQARAKRAQRTARKRASAAKDCRAEQANAARKAVGR